MDDFWIIKYKDSWSSYTENRTQHTHYQHVALDVDSIVEIHKHNDIDLHTFVVDNENRYMGVILKKVSRDDVMTEMEKLPHAR